MQLTLDGKILEFNEQQTICQLAAENGIWIPKLCTQHDDCDAGSSCMICSVWDVNRQTMIPACSAKAEDNMELESESAQVSKFRRTTLEFLLAEHRGDCTAPCQLACPNSQNIPAIIRLCINKNFEEAAKLVQKECADCGGRCEKACRLGRFDRPIAIKQIIDFLVENYPIAGTEKRTLNYQHTFGKLNKPDIELFLLEAQDSMTTDHKIQQLAVSCLHCDCRAREKCKLQQLASEFDAKQHNFKLEQPTTFSKVVCEKLIYEHGKCIKCGRCIERNKQLNSYHYIDFQQRGENLTVAPPINSNWEQTVIGIEAALAAVCPTGAMSLRED